MNRVNFKGVVEKDELLKIVRRLWTQEMKLKDGKNKTSFLQDWTKHSTFNRLVISYTERKRFLSVYEIFLAGTDYRFFFYNVLVY